MKIIYNIILISLSTILFRCTSNNGGGSYNNCQSGSEKYSIGLRKSSKQISFKLDSVSSPNISYAKILNVEDTLYFSFLNSYTNTLYVYDYEDFKLEKKITLTSDRKLTGYEIIDWDNIIVYEYWTQTLTLQNGDGKILKQMDVPKIENGYYSLPTSKTPLIFKDDDVYMTGGHMTSRRAGDEAIVSIVDKDLSKLEYAYHFPDIYQNNFFGGSHFRMDISFDYNSDKELFVFSFPAAHSVFATSNFSDQKEFCASSDFVEEIPSYPYEDEDNTFQFASENGFYFSISYDPYRKLYYRTCLMPAEQNSGDKYVRDMSVIILDENFKKVGEIPFKVDEDFYMTSLSTILVSKDGLMIKKKNRPGDESMIEFFIYEPYEI